MPIPHHFIITIHNAGDRLGEVISSVLKAADHDSVIMPVLDGCNDESEEIVEGFRTKSSKVIKPIYTSDVHEIGAINAALAALPFGHVFILQDDVVIMAENIGKFFNEKILRSNPDVGYVSMRMGGGIHYTTYAKAIWHLISSGFKIKSRLLDVVDVTYSEHDEISEVTPSVISSWAIKEIAVGIKSPVWISANLRTKIPLLDRKLMPFCYDDVDMSIESLKLGYKNFLVAVPYRSEKHWGGTRKPNSSFTKLLGVVPVRNRAYLYKKHRCWLKNSPLVKLDGLFCSWF